jgi:tRNA threonylcarbamoyladenosine biosynthesis protein TsaE
VRDAQPTVVCPAPEDTLRFGERLAGALEPGWLLSLEGPLGAGKTSLVRGIATGLGVDPREVRSPTFVLHHVYRAGARVLHHIDLYRLGGGARLELLDLDTLLDDGVVAVEWGDLAALDRWEPIRVGAEIDARRGRAFRLLGRSAPPAVRALWGTPG